MSKVYFQEVNGKISMFFEAGRDKTGMPNRPGVIQGVRLYPNGRSFLATATADELMEFDPWRWTRLVTDAMTDMGAD